MRKATRPTVTKAYVPHLNPEQLARGVRDAVAKVTADLRELRERSR